MPTVGDAGCRGGCGVPCVGAALQTQMLPKPWFSRLLFAGGASAAAPNGLGEQGGSLSLLSPVEVAPPRPRHVCAVGLEGVRIRPSVLVWLNLGAPLHGDGCPHPKSCNPGLSPQL